MHSALTRTNEHRNNYAAQSHSNNDFAKSLHSSTRQVSAPHQLSRSRSFRQAVPPVNDVQPKHHHGSLLSLTQQPYVSIREPFAATSAPNAGNIRNYSMTGVATNDPPSTSSTRNGSKQTEVIDGEFVNDNALTSLPLHCPISSAFSPTSRRKRPPKTLITGELVDGGSPDRGYVIFEPRVYPNTSVPSTSSCSVGDKRAVTSVAATNVRNSVLTSQSDNMGNAFCGGARSADRDRVNGDCIGQNSSRPSQQQFHPRQQLWVDSSGSGVQLHDESSKMTTKSQSQLNLAETVITQLKTSDPQHSRCANKWQQSTGNLQPTASDSHTSGSSNNVVSFDTITVDSDNRRPIPDRTNPLLYSSGGVGRTQSDTRIADNVRSVAAGDVDIGQRLPGRPTEPSRGDHPPLRFGQRRAQENSVDTLAVSVNLQRGRLDDSLDANHRDDQTRCLASPAFLLGFGGGSNESRSGADISLDIVSNDVKDDVIRLRRLLAEREDELRMLRSTMDSNERAMMNVFHDSRRVWNAELERSRAEFERRLATTNEAARRTKLTLQSEHDGLESMNVALRQLIVDEPPTSSHNTTSQPDMIRYQPKPVQTVCLRDGSTVPSTNALNKSVSFQPEVEILQRSTTRRSFSGDTSSINDVRGPPGRGVRAARSNEMIFNVVTDTHQTLDVDAIKHQLDTAVDELEATRQQFTDERRRWLDEKECVIKYQMILQLNYVQVMNRNAALQAELEELKRELEQVNAANEIQRQGR